VFLNDCCTNEICSEYGFKIGECDYNANDSSRCDNTQAIVMCQ